MSTIYSFNINKREQKIVRISDINSFLKVFNELINNDNYIFRGLSKDDEKYPKIIRNNKTFSLEREVHLLVEFEKYCGLYGSVRNCWEFIALAQHHGLDTRLIDFSKNPFVAAFFSLYNSYAVEYVVYAADKGDYMNVKDINFHVRNGCYLGGMSEMSFSEKIKHNYSVLLEDGRIVILEPNYANERIFAQQGLFLISPLVDKTKIDEIYNNMPIKIVIDKSARKVIWEYLSKNNFDEYHLMPDLSSACIEINRTTK